MNASTRARALQGIQAIAPLLPGIIPFGLIAGLTPVTLGYTWVDSWAGSLLMFAGASQLAAYQLLGEGATLWVILLTVAAVNLRYLLYSASIAPYLSEAPRSARWLAGYGLTDQIYAVSVRDFPLHQWHISEKLAYYGAGTAVIWALWQVCTLAGALIGQVIPVFWSLEFMIPLTFLALALGTLKTHAHRSAGAVGALVSFVGIDAPYNLGLIAGALAGVIAGLLIHRVWR